MSPHLTPAPNHLLCFQFVGCVKEVNNLITRSVVNTSGRTSAEVVPRGSIWKFLQPQAERGISVRSVIWAPSEVVKMVCQRLADQVSSSLRQEGIARFQNPFFSKFCGFKERKQVDRTHHHTGGPGGCAQGRVRPTLECHLRWLCFHRRHRRITAGAAGLLPRSSRTIGSESQEYYGCSRHHLPMHD